MRVDDPEQAAAVDLEMHDAEAAGDEQKSSAAEATPESEDTKQRGSSSNAAVAKDAKAGGGSGDKGQVKQEDHKKEGQEKEKVLDEGLLCAFRYFDKTGGQVIACSCFEHFHASLTKCTTRKACAFQNTLQVCHCYRA